MLRRTLATSVSKSTSAALNELLSHLARTLLLLLVCSLSVNAIEKADAGAVLSTTGTVRVAPGIAAAAAMVVGTLVCLFGYRLLRPAMFVCGFLAGGLLVALIIEHAFATMSWVAVASWIGFLVAGALTGSLVLMIYSVGLFLIGALAGALLAFTLNTSFMHRLWPSQPDVMLVLLIIVLALVGGLLVWKVEKPVIILATSFIGADAVVWGVGYFAGRYPSGADLKRFRFRNAQGQWVYRIPAAWWGYLVALVLLFLFGVYWQFRRSSKGVNYTSSGDATSAPAPRATDVRISAADGGYRSTGTPRRGGNPISHV